MPVQNLGNCGLFDLGHSQPGIGWEFVKSMQSGLESNKNILVEKMTSKIILTF